MVADDDEADDGGKADGGTEVKKKKKKKRLRKSQRSKRLDGRMRQKNNKDYNCNKGEGSTSAE